MIDAISRRTMNEDSEHEQEYGLAGWSHFCGKRGDAGLSHPILFSFECRPHLPSFRPECGSRSKLRDPISSLRTTGFVLIDEEPVDTTITLFAKGAMNQTFKIWL